MRLSLRFVLPLLLALAALAYAVVPLVDSLTMRWFVRDLNLRSTLIANAAQDPLRALLDSGGRARTVQFFNRLTQDERLYAVGYCSYSDSTIIATRLFPAEITCRQIESTEFDEARKLNSANGSLHVSVSPIVLDNGAHGKLVLLHDMSFVDRRSKETRKYLFYLFVGIGAIISLITVVIAQLSWRGWMQGMRALMRGEGLLRPSERKEASELHPVARDLRSLLRDLEAAHAARDEEQLNWTPETLRALLHNELRNQEVIVISNREPYLHERVGDEIVVKRPASGVVTARSWSH